jgi:uncharacterized protein with PQ loop repeat
MFGMYCLTTALLSALVYKYREFFEANPITLGFTGMACSFVYRIPQIVKLYRTKGYKDLSVSTIHLQNLGYFFYFTYAYLINDVVNIVASIVSVAQNGLLLVLIERGKRHAEPDSGSAQP